TSGKFFNRRATVSLLGGFGEVRLGRDYTPTFWNQTVFDAFGTNGLGDSAGVRQLYGGTRMDNTIGYFLPSNLGGFYGQAMVAANEGGTTLDRPGRYIGGRVGFAAGPFDIAFAGSELRFGIPFGVGSNGVTAVTTALAGQNQKTYNIGGSWDFGFMKLLGYWDRETLNSFRENTGSISGVIPFGQSEVHLGYDRSKLKLANGNSTSVDKIAATYQYNLSKRTAMYATAARLDNKDATRLTLPGAAGATVSSGKSTGAEFGIRHFF
ncbi:MAG: porin, partial [Caldimonas sp.]